MNDDMSWQELCKSVKPLIKTKVHTSINKIQFVKKRNIFSYTLDLHGYTVQEAYNKLLQFLVKHSYNKTKYITVITGKGNPNKEGLIHKEVENWLHNTSFCGYIKSFEWINGNGALKIFIKSV